MIQEGQGVEEPTFIQGCKIIWRQKIPRKVQIFGWLPPVKKVNESGTLQKNVPKYIGGKCFLLQRTRKYMHLFFKSALLPTKFVDTIGGCYL